MKYPWVSGVYNKTSAYVHLSSMHIFNALQIADEEERMVWLKVSEEDAFVPQEAYLEALEGFEEITVILLGLVRAWGDNKRQHGRAQTDKEPE